MQTIRLRALQPQSRVQILLQSLVQACGRLPIGARPVIDRSELPSALQKIIVKSQNTGRVWNAWTDEDDIWFFTGEMSLPLSRERGYPALQLGSYTVDGKIKQWQVWVCLNDGTWQQCAP